jgi:outer membrane protein assembly factor BamE
MNTDNRSHRTVPGLPTRQIVADPLTRLPRLAGALLLIVSAGVLCGCGSKDTTRSGLLEPYRTGLPQGNYLTREQVDQVRPGMNSDQVRFLLGTPLLDHIFHAGRWDYVFSYRHPNGRTELRRVVVMFSDDRVSEVVADPIPLREDASDPALPGQSRRSAARKGTDR